MKNLVFVENGIAVTDSLTVAQVFNKEHKHVIRDIEIQLEKLTEAGEKEWGVSNFGLTQYQHPQNKQWYPKYNLTEDAFAIVAMSYVTPEAMKMKVKFLDEFKRLREQLRAVQTPKTQLEILQVSIQQLVEQERRLTAVENRVEQTEKKQDQITEILSLNPTGWRKKVNGLINKIAQSVGGYGAYQDIRNESYQRLEERARCDLSTRLTNKQRKMALEGVAKSKIDKVSRMDVIAEDARLTEIYLAIVKEMAIEYQVDTSNMALKG
ncbi:Rha family transcriptional regulator [Brevibacillus sp. FSL L8-0710]|uniref:Rha family transcriptional regulator n=1 Tax=Brevibacillus sp. FSL L8-0710 TaxID=2975313 RepID=UPI0030FCA3A0